MAKETQWPKLPPKFKQKWLKALRSGKYLQGKTGVLYNKDMNEYCCLGVAEIVCETGKDRISNYTYPAFVKGSRVPKVLRSSLGNDDSLPAYLADMNDSGKSFKNIANWIEKNL